MKTKWLLLIIIFVVVGCEHRCSDCPPIIYRDKIITRVVENPVIVIISDDMTLEAGFNMAKEALIAMSSSTTTYHSILCEDGHRRHWPDYAQWKLWQINQILKGI